MINITQNNIKDFKSLIVWQKARELTQEIYKISANFPPFENYAIKSQIIRAVASIGANIAEGNGQFYIKKQLNFFNNALGSASEVRHWLVIARDNNYISEKEYSMLEEKTIEVIKMIIGYMKKLQAQITDKKIS